MSVTLECTCGKSYRLKKEVSPGKSIRCPACGNMMTVPAPAPVAVAVPAGGDDEFEALMAAAASEQVAVGAPAPQHAGTIAMAPPPLPPQPAAWTPPATTAYARPAPQRAGRPSRAATGRTGFGTVNAGVAGGLAMMAIAAVWFFVALSFNRIFFYPPIMFVLGLIAVIKGAAGG